MSVSSPAYSVARATLTRSMPTEFRPEPMTSFSVRQVWLKQAPCELLGQMLGAAGVERVGHEAGIVDRVERDAVARERHHVELRVLHDLEDARVLENRLQQVERLAHRDLRDRVAAEIEPVGGAMGERHVGRMSRHERERHADQLAAHRVGRVELHPEGEMALIARGLEQNRRAGAASVTVS